MDELDRLLEDAERRIQLGQIDRAIDSLRRALSVDPDLPEAHAFLALCLFYRKRLHAASQEARIALALEPQLELAHYALAHVRLGQRRFAEAEAHLAQLLEIAPGESQYYLLQADLYRLTRRKKQRLASLEKALELDPQSPKVLAELSDFYAGIGDLDRAEHYAYESLASHPENIDGLVSMGNVLLRRGRVREAREHALWALRQAPGDRAALHLLAAIKARANPLLGLWWRYNVWISSVGSTHAILVLLCAFILYRVAMMISGDLGRQDLAQVIRYAWFGVVIYTFIGPVLFHKSVQKELAEVRLDKDF